MCLGDKIKKIKLHNLMHYFIWPPLLREHSLYVTGLAREHVSSLVVNKDVTENNAETLQR